MQHAKITSGAWQNGWHGLGDCAREIWQRQFPTRPQFKSVTGVKTERDKPFGARHVVVEFIELAKQMRGGQKPRNKLGFTDDGGILQLLGSEQWCRENLMRHSHAHFCTVFFRRCIALRLPDSFLNSLCFFSRGLPCFLG